MWVFYAFLSALAAAAVAIFGKLGLKNVDSTLATSLRAIVMAFITFLAALGLGKYKDFQLSNLSQREWVYIMLAGVAGAASWIFYFYAIKYGVTTKAVAIDKLSTVLVFILAVLFLGEAFSWKGAFGAFLIVIGTLFMSLEWSQLRSLMAWLAR